MLDGFGGSSDRLTMSELNFSGTSANLFEILLLIQWAVSSDVAALSLNFAFCLALK
jgi:hypothetical protein